MDVRAANARLQRAYAHQWRTSCVVTMLPKEQGAQTLTGCVGGAGSYPKRRYLPCTNVKLLSSSMDGSSHWSIRMRAIPYRSVMFACPAQMLPGTVGRLIQANLTKVCIFGLSVMWFWVKTIH